MILCVNWWKLLMNSGGDDVGAVGIIDDGSYMQWLGVLCVYIV